MPLSLHCARCAALSLTNASCLNLPSPAEAAARISTAAAAAMKDHRQMVLQQVCFACPLPHQASSEGKCESQQSAKWHQAELTAGEGCCLPRVCIVRCTCMGGGCRAGSGACACGQGSQAHTNPWPQTQTFSRVCSGVLFMCPVLPYPCKMGSTVLCLSPALAGMIIKSQAHRTQPITCRLH